MRGLRTDRPIYLDERNHARYLQPGERLPVELSRRDRYPVLMGQAEIVLPIAVGNWMLFGLRGLVSSLVLGVAAIAVQSLLWGRR